MTAPDLVEAPVGAADDTNSIPLVETRTESVGDEPQARDSLGFTLYVKALADFLSNRATRPPLTLSVEGEWGSGKSSLMRQLQEELERRCQPSKGTSYGREDRRRCTFWFNAWRYESEDALWAAFTLELVREISRRMSWLQRAQANRKLLLRRLRVGDAWASLIQTILWLCVMTILLWGGLSLHINANRSKQSQNGSAPATPTLRPHVPATVAGARRPPDEAGGQNTATAIPGTKPATEMVETNAPGKSTETKTPAKPLEELAGGSGIAGAVALVLLLLSGLREVLGNPLAALLKRSIQSPDYETRVAFVSQFAEDLRRIVEAYVGDTKLFIFIDDLDRCETPRAADLMQAINLLMSAGPRLIFILGIDREKVAASIAAKHRDLLPYLAPGNDTDVGRGLTYGYTFIEKFIQIPFRVPRIARPEAITNLLDSLMESHQPVQGERSVLSHRFRWLPARFARRKSHDTARANVTPAPVKNEQQQAAEAAVRLSVNEDSKELKEIVHHVAELLDYNPRRLKQFVNLFRLSAFVAAHTGALACVRPAPGDPPPMGDLTLKRLGKLVALSIRWPRLFAELSEEPQVFNSLQKAAASGAGTEFAQYWSLYPGLREFLSPKDEHWSLSGVELSTVVNVSPTVNIRYSVPALEQMAREYEGIRIRDPNTSPIRTERLLDVVRRVRDWERANPDTVLPLAALARGSEGERVVAFVLAKIREDPSVVGIAVDVIENPRSGFEQHTTLALLDADFTEPDSRQRQRVARAIELAASGRAALPILPPSQNPGKWRLASSVYSKITGRRLRIKDMPQPGERLTAMPESEEGHSGGTPSPFKVTEEHLQDMPETEERLDYDMAESEERVEDMTESEEGPENMRGGSGRGALRRRNTPME